jgi:hypothetical protein
MEGLAKAPATARRLSATISRVRLSRFMACSRALLIEPKFQ